MEHESFEDVEVADLMNEAFVNIKLDREERPDIDQIYMTVTQMINGHGGWPMTIVMTPEKKPFFAGTYFPKHSVQGRMGMLELVPRLSDAWKTEPEKVRSSSEHITEALIKGSKTDMQSEVDYSKVAQATYTQLVARYDRNNGGFSTNPKFPTPHNLLFLMRYAYRTGEDFANKMVRQTLLEMRKGGIFDHVGYGYHRYSTDENWLLPHFEKMLYDQALLIMACTEAYQSSGVRDQSSEIKDENSGFESQVSGAGEGLTMERKVFKKTAEQTIEYVLRDMTSPEGGFYSAEDADSEGVEGKFYVWNYNELVEVLGKDDAEWAAHIFRVEAGGNFHDEATGQRSGDNILHLDSLEIDEPHRFEVVRQKLFARRVNRIRPLLDDKILTDWNGLMISALARAGRAFGNKKYIDAAQKAANFIKQNLTAKGQALRADLPPHTATRKPSPDHGTRKTEHDLLLHRFREGEAAFSANLEDYAFLTMGLIDLYQATFEPSTLAWARELTDQMIEEFHDKDNGAFYLTSIAIEDLIVRPKESYDGAIPSGNSVAMLNLIRLSRLTGETQYEDLAREIVSTFGQAIENAPSGQTFMMSAVEYLLDGGFEITLAASEKKDLSGIEQLLSETYLPNSVVLGRLDASIEELSALSAFVESQTTKNGKPTAYVCRDHVCENPSSDLAEINASLRKP